MNQPPARRESPLSTVHTPLLFSSCDPLSPVPNSGGSIVNASVSPASTAMGFTVVGVAFPMRINGTTSGSLTIQDVLYITWRMTCRLRGSSTQRESIAAISTHTQLTLSPPILFFEPSTTRPVFIEGGSCTEDSLCFHPSLKANRRDVSCIECTLSAVNPPFPPWECNTLTRPVSTLPVGT